MRYAPKALQMAKSEISMRRWALPEGMSETMLEIAVPSKRPLLDGTG
jgi:hypothetical protein